MLFVAANHFIIGCFIIGCFYNCLCIKILAGGVIPAGQSGSMSVSHQQKKETLQTPLLGAPQYSHVSECCVCVSQIIMGKLRNLVCWFLLSK